MENSIIIQKTWVKIQNISKNLHKQYRYFYYFNK